MNPTKAVLVSILSVLLFAPGDESLASNGNSLMRLAWKPRTEVIEYRSCGSADICWVAQIKNKKTKKRIASLRCDGEKLFSILGQHPEIVAAEDCHRFEAGNKFQEIPKAMRTLLHR